MTVAELKLNPHGFFVKIAKAFLKQAYSYRVASSFKTFHVFRKQALSKGCVRVECFNGGAFVYIDIYPNTIKKSGDYALHREVNVDSILKTALVNNKNQSSHA